jgi:hypothetical protein
MINGILEKVLLTLFLILGLNVFNLTHAEDQISYTEKMNRDCPIKGYVSLRLEGTTRNGELLGTVDNNYVSWFVTMGNIQGYYNGNFMNLRIVPVNYSEYSLTGWIGSYYVRWISFGGYFNERIDCRERH